MTIKNKILIPIIVLTILVIVAMSAFYIVQFSNYVNTSMENNVRTALTGAANMIEDMKPSVVTSSLYIAEDPEVVEAIKIGDYDALLARATTLQALANINMCTITDAFGTVIARVHAPALKGDSIVSNASVKSALSGKPLPYVEEGTTARLLVGAATPIYDNHGDIIGAMLTGFRLDTEVFVDLVKKMYGCEASIVLGDERISTTILNDEQSRAIGSTITEDVSRIVMAGNTYVKKWEAFNRESFLGAAPISDVSGKIVGMLLVALYADGATETFQSFVRTTFVIILFLLAAYILIVTHITNRIVAPINSMIHAANGMLLENLGIEVQDCSKDEVKNLTSVFNSMVKNTRTRMIKDDRRLLMMSALINCASQYIAYINGEGQFSFVNEAINDISGYTIDELKAGSFFMLFSAETSKQLREEVLPNIFNFGKYDFELPLVRKDGEIRIMSFSGFRLEDNEYTCEYAFGTIASDITEKKKLENALIEAKEAAEASSRAKSQFLANMSHEIRTPMNGIIGFSELALDDDAPPKTRGYLEKIKSSSEGLLRIINDILDVSKIEAGKIVLESIPFDVHRVFRTCQAITTPKALEKGITVFCYAEPSIGKRLLGDPTRLQQALLNLLSNAVKFTNVGIVKLLSSVKETSENSVTIHFEVKDSGIGMSPTQIGRIFETFTQADDSTTRKFGGTGLGLPITKNIIELMGGELNVESTPGIGSKFSFSLTFKTVDVDLNTPSYEAKNIVIEKPVFVGTVLIVEDNTLNQQVICDHLARVGLNTIVAGNGKEGVELVKRRMEVDEVPFDLIFMDIHMPVMDGLEAAKQLEVLGNTSPVVALTANIMSNDREIYKQAGMPDCLVKPFTTNELWNCLLTYITPAGKEIMNKDEMSEIDNKLHNQLLRSFWQDNQTTFNDIKTAIEAGEFKLAFRKAHTLKGIAGLIGKSSLQDAAYAVERSLAGEESKVTPEQLSLLESELNAIMSELAVIFKESLRQSNSAEAEFGFDVDKTSLLELIEDIEPMLKDGDLQCMDFINILRDIPKTDILIEQMEHYDFVSASKTLSDIKSYLVGDTNG